MTVQMPLDHQTITVTADDRGLANRWYTDADAFAEERERLFAAGWACLGHTAEVAAPGDLAPKHLMGLPLLMVRTKSGQVTVFHNVCRHRGMKLCDRPVSKRARITCPYHAWSYDLDGWLRATPHVGGEGVHDIDGFDRAHWRLQTVRSAEWFGLVFVNLDGAAAPFEDYIAPLARRWAVWSVDRFRTGGADCRSDLEVRANWKLAVENYCEAYHLPLVHPGLNSYSRLGDHYNITRQGTAAGPDAWFAGQGTRVYNPNREPAERLINLPDLPTDLLRVGEYIALFPNVLLGVHVDQAFALILEPQAPDRTIERLVISYLGDGGDGPDYAQARAGNLRAWQQVFAEDVFAVEGMQQGRASPGFDGGAFTPLMDAPTLVFHRWAQSRLAAT